MTKSEGFKDDPVVRQMALRYLDEIALAPPPTFVDYENKDLADTLSQNGNRYRTSRGINEVAVALSVSKTALQRLMSDKSVLDIGCGGGKLCEDIAKDRSTSVVGIDLNLPESQSSRSNLSFEIGSGMDLDHDLVGDFDVVTSVYSHVYWAARPDDARAGVESALRVVKHGGHALFVPVITNLGARKMVLRDYADNPITVGVVRAIDSVRVASLVALLEREAMGEISCAFRASGRNQSKHQESYSVIANVM
jgi:SAM-dependent methyltransferase